MEDLGSAKRGWVALVGMMGAGKSSVGPVLARRMGRDFVDLDQQLEAQAGLSIAEIFASHGEAAFRELEGKALLSALRRSPAGVLATGGGVILHPDNRAALEQLATSVYLRAPVEVLVARLSDPRARAQRPLLESDATQLARRLGSLLAERSSRYEEAKVVVDAQLPLAELVQAILENLQELQP